MYPSGLEGLWELIQDGLILLEGGGTLRYCNGRARELLGIPSETLPPLPLRRFSPELFFHLQDYLGSEERQIFEADITYPEKRLLRVQCLPYKELNETLYAAVLVDRTREEERDAEQLEEETCAAVQTIAGGMAHEMGNPLNTLQIQLQLLQRQLPGAAKYQKMRETVAICRGEVERLHHMVRHFLHAIRPVKPLLQSLDLNDLVRGCVVVLGEELRQRDVRIVMELADGEIRILGDEEQLQRVFFNLLRNAMEALDGGGSIALRTTQEDAFARVEVEDDGVGIAPSALPNILQLQRSEKRHGNGLGLVIVQRILRAHRSTIALRTVAPHGTLVTLRIPLENPNFPMLPGAGSETS
jgi:signal transduction histidine kinase